MEFGRGTILKHERHGRYLVASAGHDLVILVNMRTGVRWSEPIEDKPPFSVSDFVSDRYVEDFTIAKLGSER